MLDNPQVVSLELKPASNTKDKERQKTKRSVKVVYYGRYRSALNILGTSPQTLTKSRHKAKAQRVSGITHNRVQVSPDLTKAHHKLKVVRF